jgi:hypothetical protein
MEFLFFVAIVLVPLAMLSIGLSLVVNAIESVKEIKEKYGRK